MTYNYSDKPCAAPGLISYRCSCSYGWIMIGAKDHDDAMRQANRSSPHVTRDGLEVWNGTEYVKAIVTTNYETLAQANGWIKQPAGDWRRATTPKDWTHSGFGSLAFMIRETAQSACETDGLT